MADIPGCDGMLFYDVIGCKSLTALGGVGCTFLPSFTIDEVVKQHENAFHLKSDGSQLVYYLAKGVKAPLDVHPPLFQVGRDIMLARLKTAHQLTNASADAHPVTIYVDDAAAAMAREATPSSVYHASGNTIRGETTVVYAPLPSPCMHLYWYAPLY
jgi:hypothetical protein